MKKDYRPASRWAGSQIPPSIPFIKEGLGQILRLDYSDDEKDNLNGRKISDPQKPAANSRNDSIVEFSPVQVPN